MRLLALAVAAATVTFGGLYVVIDRANSNRSDSLHQSQLAGCKRGNQLRSEIQTRGAILAGLLATAEKARRASAGAALDPTTSRIDLSAAREYRRLRKKMSPVRVVDCQKAYPNP